MKFDYKEIIEEALDNYRFAHGFASRRQAIDDLGYPPTTVQRYINGDRAPNIHYFFDLLLKTEAVEVHDGYIKINCKAFKKPKLKKGRSNK